MLQSFCEESAEVWYLSGQCAKEGRSIDDAVRCYQRAHGVLESAGTCIRRTGDTGYSEPAFDARAGNHSGSDGVDLQFRRSLTTASHPVDRSRNKFSGIARCLEGT